MFLLLSYTVLENLFFCESFWKVLKKEHLDCKFSQYLVIQSKSEVGMGAPIGIGCVPIDLKEVTFHLGASVSSSINGNIVKTKSRYL